jgi:hypothetical protein
MGLDVFVFVLFAPKTFIERLPLVSLDIRLLGRNFALLATGALSLLLRHLSASFGRG